MRPEATQTRIKRVRRENGLLRVSTATRWVGAASLGLTGLFAAVVAHALPGHSLTAPAQSPAVSQSQPVGGGQTSVLQPASQAPTTTTAPPQVVSGGS